MSTAARFLLTASLLTICTTTAWAGDGVLEINQTCVAQGCFAGDTPGLPVTILSTAPGSSFRLTSDLLVPDVNTSGIVINREGAQLDLGGFEIRGPVTCSGTPTVCTAAGTGSGVVGGASRIEVFGGSVVGMGQHGVTLIEASAVRRVRAGQNGERGIDVGTKSTVSESIAARNGGFGIRASDGSIVDSSAASNNAFHGISAGYGALVSRSTASSNGLDGINLNGEGGAVSDCTATQNGTDGIRLTGANRATSNLAWLNGSDGIHAGVGSYLIGNSVRDNTEAGVRATSGAYKDNAITSNTGGTVLGGPPVNLGGNYCTDNSNVEVPCP